jgi:hypothetical protein
MDPGTRTNDRTYVSGEDVDGRTRELESSCSKASCKRAICNKTLRSNGTCCRNRWLTWRIQKLNRLGDSCGGALLDAQIVALQEEIGASGTYNVKETNSRSCFTAFEGLRVHRTCSNKPYNISTAKKKKKKKNKKQKKNHINIR